MSSLKTVNEPVKLWLAEPARDIAAQHPLALIALSGDDQNNAVIRTLCHLQEIQQCCLCPILGHAVQIDTGIDLHPAFCKFFDDRFVNWM